MEEALASMAAGSTDPMLVEPTTFPAGEAAVVYPRLLSSELMRVHYRWG
jgi:hypothetical protein